MLGRRRTSRYSPNLVTGESGENPRGASALLDVDDSAAERCRQRGGPVADVEFGEEAFHVGLHGLLSDPEIMSDFFIPLALGDELQDFHFSRRQTNATCESLGNNRRDRPCATVHLTD